MRESGRIRSQEKSFNFELGGDPDPKHALACTHGWYHTRKLGVHRRELCAKCGMPKDQAELEVRACEEARQAEIRQAQEAERQRILISVDGATPQG